MISIELDRRDAEVLISLVQQAREKQANQPTVAPELRTMALEYYDDLYGRLRKQVN